MSNTPPLANRTPNDGITFLSLSGGIYNFNPLSIIVNSLK